MKLRGRSMHYWVNRPDDGAEQRNPVPQSGDADGPIAEASSAIPGDPEPEQRKPVPPDSGNGQHSTPEPSSAKPIKKNLSKNLRRACARGSGADAGLECKPVGKPLDGAGLSASEHSAAAAWLRHVSGGSMARPELVSRLATVRKYANPAYRWLKGQASLAAEIAEAEGWYDPEVTPRQPEPAERVLPPASDSAWSGKIVAAMTREISGKAYPPGARVADRNTQLDRLAGPARVKPAYLPHEMLARQSPRP
jgi:hypothetical protein